MSRGYRETRTFYPIGPFRAWLHDRIAEYERDGLAMPDFAERIEVPERRVFRWLNEVSLVTLASVDHVVTRYGDPGLLDDLCPLGTEVKQETHRPPKCEHGDTNRSASGRCRTCANAAERRRRERLRAEAVA